MDGFVKTLGILMVLAAVALWAALIFFVPAALIKFLWHLKKKVKKQLTKAFLHDRINKSSGEGHKK